MDILKNAHLKHVFNYFTLHLFPTECNLGSYLLVPSVKTTTLILMRIKQNHEFQRLSSNFLLVVYEYRCTGIFAPSSLPSFTLPPFKEVWQSSCRTKLWSFGWMLVPELMKKTEGVCIQSTVAHWKTSREGKTFFKTSKHYTFCFNLKTLDSKYTGIPCMVIKKQWNSFKN